MGTRYEDQPPELWAGPESLDPTPVWKQFTLVGVFLLLGLVIVGVVAAFAVAPQVVSPPALVPGERLVLAPSDVPPLGAPPKRVGPPLVDDAHAFWIARVSDTEVAAFSTHWSLRGATNCPVAWTPTVNSSPTRMYTASCGGRFVTAFFTERGEPSAGAPRGLDRYLVSVSDDRVIVNLSRLIVSPERTSAPPTP
jgi:hypothetical protein